MVVFFEWTVLDLSIKSSASGKRFLLNDQDGAGSRSNEQSGGDSACPALVKGIPIPIPIAISIEMVKPILITLKDFF
jgi:hypothetical protein